MIYLTFRGFTLLELGIMEGFFHITAFLMEVPTGAVADLWGRKVSRLIGRIFFLVSLAFLYYSQSFLWQTIGFAICAIGYNLESGAGEALLYDSLKFLGRKDGFMKTNSRLELLLQGAFIASFLVGGYLAVNNYDLLFQITGLIALVSLVVGFFFTEPPIDDGVDRGGGEPEEQNVGFGHLLSKIFVSIFTQTRDALRILKNTPALLLMIIFIELIFTFTTCLFFFLQTYWKAAGWTEFQIGIVFAIQCAVAGVVGLFAPRVEKRIGPRGILLFMPLILLVCLWGVAVTPWVPLFFIATGLLEGIIIIAISDYINRRIPSETRATVLSFQSMVFSFFMIFLFPLVGIIGDKFSLDTAFFLFAVIGTLVYLFYVILFARVQISNDE